MLNNSTTFVKESSPPHLIMLILLISFGTVCAVLFTPALPQLTQYFHVSENAAQWSMTLYLVGYALGQLPYGPLANRFGRKQSLLFGISIALLGIILCLMASTLNLFALLLVGRLVMALGACVGLMMAFTLLNDFYNQQDARKLSSYMMMAFAILPALSLGIGGLISANFGWKSCFYALGLYGIVISALILKWIDNPPNQQQDIIQPKLLIQGLSNQLKSRNLLIFSTIIGCCTATIYIFATFSPFISMQLFHINETQFGAYSGIPALGILIGSLCSGKLSQKYTGKQLISTGVWIGVIGTGILFGSLYLFNHPLCLFASMACINLGLTFVMSNASILASSETTDKANASSMMSFLNLSIGALGVGIAQQCTLSLSLLPTIFMVIFGLMLVLLYLSSQNSKI